ncbi:hypothetical protein BJ742DRAFT_867027 [Cladochytrium replicatum]|nr:hypothetical protein BJ742DRAFT_867027 [Cladochytrium replicatum]
MSSKRRKLPFSRRPMGELCLAIWSSADCKFGSTKAQKQRVADYLLELEGGCFLLPVRTKAGIVNKIPDFPYWTHRVKNEVKKAASANKMKKPLVSDDEFCTSVSYRGEGREEESREGPGDPFGDRLATSGVLSEAVDLGHERAQLLHSSADIAHDRFGSIELHNSKNEISLDDLSFAVSMPPPLASLTNDTCSRSSSAPLVQSSSVPDRTDNNYLYLPVGYMEKYPGYETSSKKEYDENKDVLGLNEVFRSKPLFGKPDDVSGFGLNMVDGVLNIRDIGRYPVRDWRIVRGDAVPLWKPRSNHGSWEETARFPGRNADFGYS